MDIRPPPHVMAWLGPLILVNVFIWIVFLTPEVRGTICAKSDNCLTDWLSALGGWVALTVAIPTIYFLNKQIQDANRHNTNFAKIQLRRSEAIARRTKRQAADLEAIARAYVDLWLIADPPTTPEAMRQKFSITINRLREEAGNTTFDLFEDEIGTAHPTSLLKLRRMIASAETKMEEVLREADALQQLQAMVQLIGHQIVQQRALVTAAADAFLNEVSIMVSSTQEN